MKMYNTNVSVFHFKLVIGLNETMVFCLTWVTNELGKLLQLSRNEPNVPCLAHRLHSFMSTKKSDCVVPFQVKVV